MASLKTSSVEQPTATAERRTYLRIHGLPPSLTAVWMAQHGGRLDFHHYLGHIDVQHQDRPWNGDEERHVLMCSMAFKGLAMFLRTDGLRALGAPNTHQRPSKSVIQQQPLSAARRTRTP
jgi:hypothetical protein